MSHHQAVHLLLQAEPGMQSALYRHVAALPDVVEAAVTSGPYDVIARVGTADPTRLDAVLTATRAAPGLWLLAVCRGAAAA